MKKAPLALLTEKFKDKAGLIAAVRGLATDDLWVGRTNEDKGLDHVSNAKLLRLHNVLSAVKKAHGSRAAMIEAIMKLEKRTKDEGFKSRLEKHSTPRLWDQFQAAKKRSAD